MARLRRFFAEAPIFFIAVVVGVALTFKVAIGWAKTSSNEPTEKDPTVATSPSKPAAAGEGAPSSTTRSTSTVVTAEPRPAATATVPTTPRKKPRPRR